MYHRAVWVTGFRSKFICASAISSAGPVPLREAMGDAKEQCLADISQSVQSSKKHSEFLPLLYLC